MKHRGGWPLIVPALVVIILYLPALRHGFVWDDTIFLRDMPAYRHPALLGQAMIRPFVLSPNYWRPLGVLLFGAQLQAGALLGARGLNPAIMHLANIVLHAANTTLVALLAGHLLPDDGEEDRQRQINLRWVSLAAALIYGLHPALLEGVAFISSQFDLLVTFFLLLALLLDARVRSRTGRPIAVALCFLLAALSKEMAVALVVVLPLWHLARRRPARGTREAQRHAAKARASSPWQGLRGSGNLPTYLAMGFAGAAYLALRYMALGYLMKPSDAAIAAGNPLQHLLLVTRSLARYVVLILWPFTSLTPIHYSTLPVAAYDLAAWASLAVLVGVGIGLVALVRRAPRSGWLVTAGALALLPVSNILPLELDGGAYIAERFLLYPLALLVLGLVPLAHLLASQLNRAWSSLPWTGQTARFPVWVLPTLWLVASAATVQLVLPNWRDDLSLWTWGARRAPLSPTPPTNLALAYVDLGNYDRAIAESDRALQLDASESNAWNNLGLAMFYKGDYEKAQGAFEEAIRLEPKSAMFWSNLAAAYREQDRLGEAERILLEEVLVLDPTLPVGHLNLGIVYKLGGRPDLAVGHLQEALALLPPEQRGEAQAQLAELEEPEPWLDLGARFLANEEPEAALAAYEQADRLGAAAVDTIPGASRALIELDALSEAEALIARILEQAPDDPRLYVNLGLIAQKQGDVDAAREYLQRAARLAPQWEEPQQLLQSLGSQ